MAGALPGPQPPVELAQLVALARHGEFVWKKAPQAAEEVRQLGPPPRQVSLRVEVSRPQERVLWSPLWLPPTERIKTQ